MFCNKCGNELRNGDIFCSKCGTQVTSNGQSGNLPYNNTMHQGSRNNYGNYGTSQRTNNTNNYGNYANIQNQQGAYRYNNYSQSSSGRFPNANNNNNNQNYYQTNQTYLPMSGLAIASLVLGIIAITSAFIPIVNFVSIFIAIIGGILGIIGLVEISKGNKRSKGIGATALILNILALFIAIAALSFCSYVAKEVSDNTLNNLTGNPTKTTKNSNEAKVGESLIMDNDLEITVVSVEGGLKNYDGSSITKVTVKYVNNGKNDVSYNFIDWKAENSSGAQTSTTIYSNGQLSSSVDLLGSGKLSPGGTISGTMYFKGDVVKMLYSSSIISDTTATWIVK